MDAFDVPRSYLTMADFTRLSDGAPSELIWGVLMGLVHAKRIQMTYRGKGMGRKPYFTKL